VDWDQQGFKLDITGEIYSSLVKSESVTSMCSRLNVTRSHVLSMIYKRGGTKPSVRRDIATIKNTINHYGPEESEMIVSKLPQINFDFIQFILKYKEKSISSQKKREPTIHKGDKVSVIKGSFRNRVFKVLEVTNMNIQDTPKLEYVKVDTGEGVGEEYILETWVVKC